MYFDNGIRRLDIGLDTRYIIITMPDNRNFIRGLAIMSEIINYVLRRSKKRNMLIIMCMIALVYFALNQFINYHMLTLPCCRGLISL